MPLEVFHRNCCRHSMKQLTCKRHKIVIKTTENRKLERVAFLFSPIPTSHSHALSRSNETTVAIPIRMEPMGILNADTSLI